MDDEKQNKQVEEKFKVFQEKLPELLKTHKDKYVLMKDRKIIAFFDSLEDVHKEGTTAYKDGIFSVQQVKEMPLDLGYFSHAVSVI